MSSSITLLQDRANVRFDTPLGVVIHPIHKAKHIAVASANIAELETALQNPGIAVPVGTYAKVPASRNYGRYGVSQ